MTQQDTPTSGPMNSFEHSLRRFSVRIDEESANQITHGFGWALSAIGVSQLLPAAYENHQGPVLFSCVLYAVSLVSLFAVSTLSHSFRARQLRHFFRTLDQSLIALFMAASFTPFAVVYMTDPLGRFLLIAEWGVAIAAIFYKILIRRRRNVGLWVYLVLGWLPTIGAGSLIQQMPAMGLAYLAGGGILFMCGIYFWIRDVRVRYSHAVWHVFVIGGAACHFCAIHLYVI